MVNNYEGQDTSLGVEPPFRSGNAGLKGQRDLQIKPLPEISLT
jgi:hypothetical protein